MHCAESPVHLALAALQMNRIIEYVYGPPVEVGGLLFTLVHPAPCWRKHVAIHTPGASLHPSLSSKSEAMA